VLSTHCSQPQLWLIFNHAIKLVFNGDTGKWSHLARGTAFLLYSRGVHRYTSAFDYTMLESQLGFVVRVAYTMHFFC
jgi:hypothetical protein